LSFKLWNLLGVGAISAGLLLGCASARMSDHQADDLFRQQQYDQAATHLEEGLQKQGDDGRDSLLYVLDVGLALHSAGKYEESNKYLLKANDLAVIKDYTSLSKEAGTLLVSDNIKDYKVEDFENVLINTYLAMNYAMMGNREDALVEARRTNQKLYMMVSEGKRKYKQNAFVRYISAILYESDGDYDDAYVDYKNTYDLVPNFPGLGRDLWRLAVLNENDDDAQKWNQTFHLTKADHDIAMVAGPKSGRGEIIVLYENGISPIKKPNPQFKEVPKFYPRYNPVYNADVVVNGNVMGTTATLENIEATAIENLDEKYGGLVAKKVAGLVAKGAVGYGVAKLTNSPLLGFLTSEVLVAADQADVRSWNLLPKDLQVLRIPVAPGTYTVRVLPKGGAPSGEKTIQVTPGQRVFVNFRYMP
jgi:hypothetical protein